MNVLNPTIKFIEKNFLAVSIGTFLVFLTVLMISNNFKEQFEAVMGETQEVEQQIEEPVQELVQEQVQEPQDTCSKPISFIAPFDPAELGNSGFQKFYNFAEFKPTPM